MFKIPLILNRITNLTQYKKKKKIQFIWVIVCSACVSLLANDTLNYNLLFELANWNYIITERENL